MKKCTYCGKAYPNEAKACDIDQEPLRPVALTPAPPARFKNDKRLWFWIGFGLFLTITYLPLIEMKGPSESIFVLMGRFIIDNFHGYYSFPEFLKGTVFFLLLALVPAIFSILVAWLIQGAIVVMWTKMRKKTGDEGYQPR
jgi:hypothetical protein